MYITYNIHIRKFVYLRRDFVTIRNQGTGFDDSYHERTQPASYQHIDFAIADACPALETEDGLMCFFFCSLLLADKT